MKPTRPQIIVFALGSLIALSSLSEISFPTADRNFLGDTKRAELTKHGSITQVFQAEQEAIEGVRIFMGDTELGIGEWLEFQILDPSCQKVLRQKTHTLFSLPGERGVVFHFDPISESAGKTYCLSIAYRSGWIDRKDRPYIRVTDLVGASYTDSGKQKSYPDRTLQFRPLYAPEGGHVIGRIRELENRLSQYKPAFAKGNMMLLGTMSTALGALFFILIDRANRRSRD